jgi:hypothetical protein
MELTAAKRPFLHFLRRITSSSPNDDEAVADVSGTD